MLTLSCVCISHLYDPEFHNLSFCFLSCKMGLALTPYEAYQLLLCACADSEYECLGR